MLTRRLGVTVCAPPLLFAVALLHAETASPPQEVPQHQNEAVSLLVLVLDRDRRPVIDLKPNELELHEGKEEQAIESISRSPAAPAKIGFLLEVSSRNAAALRDTVARA